MNQGPICAKVYPEGIQPIKGNNCGLIPAMKQENGGVASPARVVIHTIKCHVANDIGIGIFLVIPII